jgi:hypothetical protein
MKVLVKYLKGALKGRVDYWDFGSAVNAEKKGIVKIIKRLEKMDVVIK